MKKSLMLGIGAVLLFTGCCKKLELTDCDENCNAPMPVKPVKTISKPLIKTFK